jgi:hypothetical protein
LRRLHRRHRKVSIPAAASRRPIIAQAPPIMKKINADHTSLVRRLLGARRPGAAGVPVLEVATVH